MMRTEASDQRANTRASVRKKPYKCESIRFAILIGQRIAQDRHQRHTVMSLTFTQDRQNRGSNSAEPSTGTLFQ
jgi:hypothetical protein